MAGRGNGKWYNLGIIKNISLTKNEHLTMIDQYFFPFVAGYKANDACFKANTEGDEYGNCGNDQNENPVKCAEE